MNVNFIVIIIVSLLVMGIMTHVIFFLSYQMLSIGFLFRITYRAFFEVIVFMLIMLPFDISD